MFAVILKSLIRRTEILNLGLMMATNIMMFGFMLGSIGIMGQYIGRIFDESKGRPIYIIDNTINYRRVDKKYKISC